MASKVRGEFLHRRVAPRAIFLERSHRDPVKIAVQAPAQGGDIQLPGLGDLPGLLDGRGLGARALWLLLADDAQDLPVSRLEQPPRMEGGLAAQELVEQDPQRVDVTAGVDVDPAHPGLLGAHVDRRAEEHVLKRVKRVFSVSLPWPPALAMPKSITFATGLSAHER